MTLTPIDIVAIVLPILIMIVGWSFYFGKFMENANRAFKDVENIRTVTSRLDTLFVSYFDRIFPLIERLLFRGTSGNPRAVSEDRVRYLLGKAKRRDLSRPERDEIVNIAEKALEKSDLDELEARILIASIDAFLAYAEAVLVKVEESAKSQD